MAVLAKEIQDKIDELINEAYLDFQNEKYEQSYEKQLKAWDLFPTPKFQWNEGYNTAKYIFEDRIILKQLDEAKKWLNEMIENNNNLHLMDFDLSFNIGKFHFENNEYEKAIEEWGNLISQTKFRYFEGEDKEYLTFVKNPDKYIKK